jgi:hypothetical protein
MLLEDCHTRRQEGDPRSSLRLVHQAPDTEHQHREIHERVKRGGRAVHPVAQAAEALEPADGALDDVALSLERSVLGVQLARRLLGWDASPGRDERPEAVIVDKSPEAGLS